MTNLHELFEEATAAAPPSRLSVDDVFAATRSHRRDRQMKNILVAVAVMAMAATTGLFIKTGFSTHPPTGAAPPFHVSWAARGDAKHLYLTKDTCSSGSMGGPTPDPTHWASPLPYICGELWASNDGGLTWLSRGSTAQNPRVLGPLTLMRFAGDVSTPEPGTDPAIYWELSVDGGATWSRLPATGAPIEAAPPGGLVFEFDRRLVVLDPTQRRLRPLAEQPALRLGPEPAINAGPSHIWVSGLTRGTNRPAVAVSHDGGSSWTERELPGAQVLPQPTLPGGETDPNVIYGQPARVIAGEGLTAYVTMWDGSDPLLPLPAIPGTDGFGWLKTWRTTDGGASWQAVSAKSTTPSFMQGWMASGDRAVVALAERQTGGWVMDSFAMTTDGLTYAPVTPPGLPTAIHSIDGATAFTNRTVYVSDDGWTWRQVWQE